MPCAVAEPITQGQEAFVPPANFAEFYERYPRLVRWWLYNKMKCPIDLIPDYEQSLFVYLMGRSKNMAAAGIQDRIASYKEEKLGENLRNPFGAWVGYICGTILRNEYTKMVGREIKVGVERKPTTLSLSGTEGCSDPHVMMAGWLHTKDLAAALNLTPGQMEDLWRCQCSPSHSTAVVSSMFWAGFLAYVDDHAPQITPLLRSLEDYDSLGAARAALGIPTGTYRTYRTKLVALLKDYRNKKKR